MIYIYIYIYIYHPFFKIPYKQTLQYVHTVNEVYTDLIRSILFYAHIIYIRKAWKGLNIYKIIFTGEDS